MQRHDRLPVDQLVHRVPADQPERTPAADHVEITLAGVGCAEDQPVLVVAGAVADLEGGFQVKVGDAPVAQAPGMPALVIKGGHVKGIVGIVELDVLIRGGVEIIAAAEGVAPGGRSQPGDRITHLHGRGGGGRDGGGQFRIGSLDGGQDDTLAGRRLGCPRCQLQQRHLGGDFGFTDLLAGKSSAGG